MSNWEDWEKEHGQDARESRNNEQFDDELEHECDHDHTEEFTGRMAVQPYMGDPLCTEYDRIVHCGAEILKAMEQGRAKNEFGDEVRKMWKKWAERVNGLGDILNPPSPEMPHQTRS